MQQVVDAGRIPLNDTAKVRYADDELRLYGVHAILRIRDRRPDLFMGRYSALPADLALTDPFPLRDELVPAVADYITARAETRDDEFVEGSRAAGYLALFDRAVG
jgi:hypothetical protein